MYMILYSLQFYLGKSKNLYDPLGNVSDTLEKFTFMLFVICDVLDRPCDWTFYLYVH
jgi:hypothetical protein